MIKPERVSGIMKGNGIVDWDCVGNKVAEKKQMQSEKGSGENCTRDGRKEVDVVFCVGCGNTFSNKYHLCPYCKTRPCVNCGD